ncbi:DUF4219 domain-containing protein [Cephalotus follicularis]|uniref:DUF4219 domain-containing protein n=1 Tax=Cephalotus follicularis TaxID=3775 RepID=A0A1Q3C5K8_CEPFO|nr:DUF4219 domain-containing protein [Cephalotus follicularis]
MNFNSSESQNISKPPFFDGNNYSHWKAKMTIFIQSLDYNLWDLIVDGPNLPTIINENGEIISKPRNKYNDDDRKIVQLNAKAKHVIICAINSNEFNRVSSCVSAKEMWDRLEVTYEGTNQVKEAKDLLGSLLTHELAMWRIEHGNEEMVVFKSLIKENSDDEEEEVSKEWKNRYDFSSDDEEVTNFCMMAIEEGLNNEVYKFSHTYNEPYKFVIDFKDKWLNPD